MDNSDILTSNRRLQLAPAMQAMSAHRPTSWLNEIDHARPRDRAPSIPGSQKQSRSLSFPANFGQHNGLDPRATWRQAHGHNGFSGSAVQSPQSPRGGYTLSTSPQNSHGVPRVPAELEASFRQPIAPQPKLPPLEDVDEKEEFLSIRELYSPPTTPHPGTNDLANLRKFELSNCFTGMPSANRHAFYCVVAFKAWRAEVYIRDPLAQFAVDVDIGSNVIVEADRGQDIGVVMFTSTSLYKADRYARNLNLKHHRELVRSSFRFSQHWREIYLPPCTPSSSTDPNRRIKIIKRHANQSDVLAIRDKEDMEARSKRLCQDLIARHRLDMEVLEAEWQSDYQRLTFFYFSPNYVVFNALVHDLFRIFKKRIWMSSVNATTAGRSGGLAGFDPTAGGFLQGQSGGQQHAALGSSLGNLGHQQHGHTLA
ncbi:hypothetical protein FH972_021838 [Carpinus fangiana]|uniref:PSP1 C-terminal domain-containing protein n=1 Tax=Carpinus fangiana TaxID=176857 RepID=A0A5N6KQH0_9ROSI|nr:hypothetical protein FH972_021838 [Carpinus fangiana]